MKKIMIITLSCVMMSLVSCDKIKEATSQDFTVNDISFDFSAESKADGVSSSSSAGMATFRAAATRTFTVTRVVDISEIGSSDVEKYANKINKVFVSKSSIKVEVIPAGTYTIENFTVEASGVPGSITIPSYTTGSVFTTTSDMNAFTSAFIMKLLSAKSVSVTVNGMTDAPVGTILNINYKNTLIFTASIL